MMMPKHKGEITDIERRCRLCGDSLALCDERRCWCGLDECPLCGAPEIPEGYFRVITVCGSTKFKEEYEWLHKELIFKDWLVFSVGAYGHRDDDTRIEGRKDRLDAIHLMKITRSDAVFIINPKGYIGDSTRRELSAAGEMGKEIYFWDDNR